MRPSRAHVLSVCGCTPIMRLACLMKHMLGIYYIMTLNFNQLLLVQLPCLIIKVGW